MQSKEIREIILKELPRILKQDKELQHLVLRISKEQFADKEKTEDRFDKILKELAADREIQTEKWQENQKVIREILESIKMLNRKHEGTVGALGARWGLRSEQSFRNALKGILGEVTELMDLPFIGKS